MKKKLNMKYALKFLIIEAAGVDAFKNKIV